MQTSYEFPASLIIKEMYVLMKSCLGSEDNDICISLVIDSK